MNLISLFRSNFFSIQINIFFHSIYPGNVDSNNQYQASNLANDAYIPPEQDTAQSEELDNTVQNFFQNLVAEEGDPSNNENELQ